MKNLKMTEKLQNFFFAYVSACHEEIRNKRGRVKLGYWETNGTETYLKFVDNQKKLKFESYLIREKDLKNFLLDFNVIFKFKFKKYVNKS